MMRTLYNRMLKGLKKKPAPSVAEPQDKEYSRVRSQVNEHSIRQAEMREAEDEEHRAVQEDSKGAGGSDYEACMDAFLNGRTEQLGHMLDRLQAKARQSERVVAAPSREKGKFEYNLSFEEEQVKRKNKKRNRPIMASNRVQEYCLYCPDNEDLTMLSASNYAYLALPRLKTFEAHPHFILAPVDHEQTSIGLNADTLTEIDNYKKCLLQAYDRMGLVVVFFEQYSRENSHIYTECLAVPPAKAQDLPFFFKQALTDVEGDWGTHKSIIRIDKEKGGLQRQIPKQIKYFYVDFSLGYGYAHPIENQRFWKRDFCYEVLATSLNMEIHRVKTSLEFEEEELAARREAFEKIWRPFDWTQLI